MENYENQNSVELLLNEIDKSKIGKESDLCFWTKKLKIITVTGIINSHDKDIIK